MSSAAPFTLPRFPPRFLTQVLVALQEIHDFLEGGIPFTDLQMVLMDYDEFIAALNLMMVKLYAKKRTRARKSLCHSNKIVILS